MPQMAGDVMFKIIAPFTEQLNNEYEFNATEIAILVLSLREVGKVRAIAALRKIVKGKGRTASLHEAKKFIEQDIESCINTWLDMMQEIEGE
jgi:hypothetical protein